MNGKGASAEGPAAVVIKQDVNGIGVVRSLGRRGVKVMGVEVERDPPDSKYRSKYCSKVISVGDPFLEGDSVLQSFLSLAEGLDQKPFLIPTSDLFVEFVSERREELQKGFLLHLPTKEAVRTILSKETQYRFAQEHGVEIPATFYPASLEDARRIARDARFPLYLKPLNSALWARSFPAKGLRAEDKDELVKGYERAEAAHLDVVVQEIIVGPATNLVTTSGYFRDGGEPVATYQSRKVRQYPVDFGIGCMLETYRDEEARRISLDFVRKLGYRGICEVELKKDERDGRYRLIELNPRSWTQVYQPTQAGINLPYIQYCDVAGLPQPEIQEYEGQVRWWDAMNDYRAYVDLRRRGQLTRGRWIRSWFGTECYSTFAWDDLGPVLQRTGYGVKVAHLLRDAYMDGRDPFKA